MRRPQWIAALLLALVVAGVFAWLGQWQMSFAIQAEDENAALSEVVRPLPEVGEAGEAVTDRAAGMVVETRGSLVPGDFRVIEQRMHGDVEGAWVTGHLSTVDGNLAVAIGWAPSVAEAERAIEELDASPALSGAEFAVEGRYMPSDGPVVPDQDGDPTRIASMAPAQLVNLWEPFEGPAYGGYLLLHPGALGDPLDSDALVRLGLEPIDSVPPLPVESINWLNLFYAIEWVVFAGFAIFFWYRLARDAWEKEHELQLLAANGAENGEQA